MAKCFSCGDTSGRTDDRIGCEICFRWPHLKYAHLHGVIANNIKFITWSCDMCYGGQKKVDRDNSELEKIMLDLHGELNDLKKQVKKLVDSKMEDDVVELGPDGDVISAK